MAPVDGHPSAALLFCLILHYPAKGHCGESVLFCITCFILNHQNKTGEPWIARAIDPTIRLGDLEAGASELSGCLLLHS